MRKLLAVISVIITQVGAAVNIRAGERTTMTKIYLIRHAEAEGNLFRRAQGHWNGRVTPLGKRQIEALSRRFENEQIDAAYSSDLDRTVETAGAVLKGRDLELVRLEALREICMGVWEGEAWGNLTYKYPEQMRLFNTDLSKWEVPGSESYESVQRRITDTVLDIAEKHEGGTVCIVSHGMAIKIFLMGVLGVPASESMKLGHGDNTSVSLVEVENGKINALYWNDNSHLGEELSTFAKQRWWRREDGRDESDLRFVPLNLKIRENATYYTRCYADSWRAAHGSTALFYPSVYLSAAKEHAASDPESLLLVMCGDFKAGLLELDPKRQSAEGIGWISLCYLSPDFRGHGLGVQLIGCAAAYYSRRGRSALRLHAAVTNTSAIAFYERYGFREIAREAGVASEQLLMEREI